MIDEDRCLQPNKQYLEKFLEAEKNQIIKRQYLKKKSLQVLPCQLENLKKMSPKKHKTKNIKQKTKAQIYEDIKLKNRNKFGEKISVPIDLENREKQVKKIKPSEMTVKYLSKPKICLEESKKNDQKKIPIQKTQKTQIVQKQKYDKLLDYFKEQLSKLEEDKIKFKAVSEKLKFKDLIKEEKGLDISKDKRIVEKMIINKLIKTQRLNEENGDGNEKEKEVRSMKKQPPKKHPAKNIICLDELQYGLECQRNKVKELEINPSSRELKVHQVKYEIKDIYLLPNFNPETLYEYIQRSNLKHDQNTFYQEALNVFNSKFVKKPHEVRNVENQEEEYKPLHSNLKVKFIQEKRIIKYDNNWIEVWIPGKQRLLTNNQGFKVIWLANGDVKQQFQHQISTYFSKVKNTTQLNFQHFLPIYYHQKLEQIWQQTSEGEKQIIFKDGRKEVIS